MGNKHRNARKHIIAMHRAGIPVEELAKAAPVELGVRSRFVYRVLGYERHYNRRTRKTEWVKPLEAR